MGLGPLVIIDGMNTFLRNYVRSPYTNANGERAGGLSGTIISVRKCINDFKGLNCLVVWDGEGGSQARRSIYKDYKAGRTVRLNHGADGPVGETPEQALENMRWQRNVAQEYLGMLGVPQVRCSGVEADDLMAYVAGKMDHPGGCIIVSTDRDMLQLIRDTSEVGTQVRVYSPIKKKMYDRATFIEEVGILPENFRLMKALTGDSSDNIEGIKGCGDKTVVKTFPLLAERKASAEDIVSTIDAGVKGVVGKSLAEGKSRFAENLTLVDLSEPMLSATAARQAREALRRELNCREVEFRVRLVRDGITFSGDNFAGVFRDFALRRKRHLADTADNYHEIDTHLEDDPDQDVGSTTGSESVGQAAGSAEGSD